MLPVSAADLRWASVTSCMKRGNPFGCLRENVTLKSKKFSREKGWGSQSCVTWTLQWTRLRIQWEIQGWPVRWGCTELTLCSALLPAPLALHTPKPYPSTLRVVALRLGWTWGPASPMGQGRACHSSTQRRSLGNL